MDEQQIEEAWENFMDIIVQESMDGCDGASDEYLISMINQQIERSFPNRK